MKAVFMRMFLIDFMCIRGISAEFENQGFLLNWGY